MIKFFLPFLMTIVTTAIAQEPRFNWGQLYTKSSTPAEVQVVGYSTGGYYIINRREPTEAEQRSILRSAFSPVVTAEYINGEGVRTFSKDISTGRSEDYVNTVYFNNSLQLIYALLDKDAGKNILWAKPINAGGSEGKPVELASIVASKMSQRGSFSVSVSPDGTKLLVLTQPEYVKDQQEKIGITLFSGAFAKEWSTEQTFSYPPSRSIDNRPFVNNNGTAYILKLISMKGSDDSWSVFSFGGKNFKEHKIVLSEKKLASYVQCFSATGDFTLAGYLKNEGAKVRVMMGEKATGNFICQVDATGEKLTIATTNSFDKRNDIIARKIVFMNDKVILLGERYTVSDRAASHSSSEPKTNENMFARDYTYNGMDIIIDGFDSAGKPLYYASIEKNNSSKNDLGYWVSYFAEVVNDKLQFVFMDNFSRYDDKKISINTPNIIVFASMDASTGKVEKPVPVQEPGPVGGKGGDTYFRPGAFLKIAEGKYITRAENATHYRMGSMNF